MVLGKINIEVCRGFYLRSRDDDCVQRHCIWILGPLRSGFKYHHNDDAGSPYEEPACWFSLGSMHQYHDDPGPLGLLKKESFLWCWVRYLDPVVEVWVCRLHVRAFSAWQRCTVVAGVHQSTWRKSGHIGDPDCWPTQAGQHSTQEPFWVLTT